MADTTASTAGVKVKQETDKITSKSLAKMAEKKVLEDLADSFKTHARSATFACGGSVPFSTNVKTEDPDDGTESDPEPRKIRPVQVRFGEDGKGNTVIIPDAKASSKQFQALFSACQPASFGRGGEEVLDEDYRKAGKLDHDDFATSFCPYEAGIIDVVAQLLLPQTSQEKHMRSIRAELYKLNIYSAPSGKFKAHVDTPRSKAQIGSLVVSVPSEHKALVGGELVVRHLGQEIIFDWSTSPAIKKEGKPYRNKPTVKWAAFYSDCEHEVLEVTAGHRVTLTYNLYVCRGQGHLARSSSLLDPTQLPLYGNLKAALAAPGFLRKGQILGIWLTHSYAHTSKHLNFLPSSLKGADMSLYETAHSLGLESVVVPIISIPGFGGRVFSQDFYGFNEGRSAYSGEELDELTGGWGIPMAEKKVTWLNPEAVQKAVKKKEHEKTKQEKALDRAKAEGDMKEVQTAYITYGNEPGIGINYSRAAMLLRIPPFKDRGGRQKLDDGLMEALVSRRGFFDDDPYYDSEEDYDDEDGDEDEFDDAEEDFEDKGYVEESLL